MEKKYIQIAEIPNGEKIVSAITYGGGWNWNWKYPFIHYQEPRYLVATEKAIYEVIPPIIKELDNKK